MAALTYSVDVSWSSGLTGAPCELNYKIQWKDISDADFTDAHSRIVQSNPTTITIKVSNFSSPHERLRIIVVCPDFSICVSVLIDWVLLSHVCLWHCALCLQELLRDRTYDFRVSAFTNISSDLPVTSDIVSYTIGPPSPPRGLEVDLSAYPRSVTVSWQRPTSPHHITVYVVMLAEGMGNDGQTIPQTQTVDGKHTVLYYYK